MAQYSKKRKEYFGTQNLDLHEVMMIGTKQGRISDHHDPFPVAARPYAGGSSAFGENLTAQLTPVVQLDGIYGLNGAGGQADQYQIYTFGTGSTATTNDESEYVATAGTDLYSYSVIRSARFLRYRPGQGAMGRFVARFTAGKANTEQRAGLFSQEGAYQVGYNGTEFGVLHSYGGQAEIRTFTLTADASESVTLTVNGVAYATTLVAADTLAQNCALIVRSHSFTGWLVEQIDNTIRFLAEDTAAKAGAFSFTAATSTGSWVQNQAATAPTDNWIPQSDWNGDKMDGSGDPDLNPSGITLDPTKHNVFQVQYRWLGAGRVRFSMEDPSNGEIVPIHDILWSNRNETFHMINPSMKIGFVAYNLSGASGSVTVYGGSMMLAIEGLTPKNDYSRSATQSKTSVSSGAFRHLFSIRNPIVNYDKTNTKEIIIQDLSVASQNNDPVEVHLFLNAPLATGNHVYADVPESVVSKSTVDGTIDGTTHTPVTSFVLGINGSQQFDLGPFRFVLPAGSTTSICVQSASNISRVVGSLVWIAD